jgi:hypothetical protein
MRTQYRTTMDLNLNSLLYLFFRLSPFIIVCFFTLSSIFNSELKGLVYLIGLVFTCFMGSQLVSALGEAGLPGAAAPVCSSFTINGFVNDVTPLGLVILSYTFFYLVYPIAKYKLAADNIILLVFFPILLLAEIYWNTSMNCFPLLNCFWGLVIGGSLGVAWASIIDATKLRGLQYYNIGSNRERCTRASKQRFVCTTYKNGKPVNYVTTS